MRSPASFECNARVFALSRELAVVVSSDGVIRFADERAQRVWGDGLEATKLRALAVPGTEEMVDAFVERAVTKPVERAELSLLVKARPVTISFRSEPCEGGAVLVGLRLTDDDTDSFSNMAATLAETAELHRAAERNRRELLDSHRALVTLHAELDDKSESLRRSTEVKTRVVSNVSHEFRTPINSILGITQLLLDRLDGELTSEQETQVRFIRTSAETLNDLVNDLLDLSRIEAGRYELRVAQTDGVELLSSLRGMMKPIVTSQDVQLVVDDPPAPVPLNTDAGKVSQILRNLVSNALKFTERGEVRVSVRAVPGERVRFEVRDTGIGIAPDDQERIFEEFTQIDSPLQRKVRGTGLGLSLSRRLADILGGQLTVSSRLGEGSVFSLEIPRVHEEIEAIESIVRKSAAIDRSKVQVLVVEDNRQTLFLYEKYLSNAGFQVLPARTIEEARVALERVRPGAIVLDVMLEGESTWSFLHELKEGEHTRDIPVMVVTVVDRAQKARALGADEFWLKPVDGERLTRKLASLARRGPVARVLVVDDDPAARYLIRKLLADAPYAVIEAATASEAVKMARDQRPDVILLDFVLGTETAFDVLDDLKADADMRRIPVILQTAKSLDDVERSRLERETAAILRKQSLSREIAITRIREALESAGLRSPAGRPT